MMEWRLGVWVEVVTELFLEGELCIKYRRSFITPES